jgi:hypothetical protein
MNTHRDTRVVFESLAAEATMAASSHNTQPWRFEIGEDRIRIVPDFARRCPVIDPDDHHLYASLGCAAENMVLAAASRGWDAVVEVQSSGNAHRLEVLLKPGTPVASPLAGAIARRQCTRTGYDGRQVPVDELELLGRAASGTGVTPTLITERARLETVADWVAQGNAVQLRDPRWREDARREKRKCPRSPAEKAKAPPRSSAGPSVNQTGHQVVRTGFGSSGRTRTYPPALRHGPAKLRRGLAADRLHALRAKAGNPPVNSRITPVLPGVAGVCRELPEGADLSGHQELATCRNVPPVAGSCRELWRPKGKKKATL